MIINKGDLVRSKELSCLGFGEAMCDSGPELHDGRDDLRIVTVRWGQDPHGHLPEDHSSMEDWDITDLELVDLGDPKYGR